MSFLLLQLFELGLLLLEQALARGGVLAPLEALDHTHTPTHTTPATPSKQKRETRRYGGRRSTPSGRKTPGEDNGFGSSSWRVREGLPGELWAIREASRGEYGP